VRVQLTNHSSRDGLAVVQVYVRDVEASVTRPDHRLAAWARVPVASGKSAMAEIEIKPAALEIVNADGKRVIEPGMFHALVGFSSLVTGLKVLPFTVD
jgi:beta-glucosidase